MTLTPSRRRHARSILLFALAFALLFGVADTLLHDKRQYSATWTRIRRENRVPQVLILGNSHAFCSFVPDILNQTLGVDAALLAASGINSIATTDSFAAALHTGTPEYIVVEANAYTFLYDTTAQAHKANALSHINGMPRMADRIRSAWRQFGYESVPQGAFQLLRSDLMWKRWRRTDEPATAADGSSLLCWHASGTFDAKAMQDDARRFAANAVVHEDYADPRNIAQFERLMALAKQHGVKVLLAKAPTEHQTQMGSDMLLQLETIACNYGDTFLGMHDFHTDAADMGLVVSDYYDNTHLSRSGAAKMTLAFARWMGEATGLLADETKAFAYGGESVEQLDEGTWRYRVETIGTDVTYRFMLDGEVMQGFGASNTIDIALNPAEGDRLSVTLRKGGNDITLPLMATNTCIFN